MLKRIKVENFKSLKHLDYKCAKLNLLTGLNGAGKSSFIQFLRLMRECAGRIGELNFPVSKSDGFDVRFSDIRYCYAPHVDHFNPRFGVTFQGGNGVEYTIKRSLREADPDGVMIAHLEHERMVLDEEEYGEWYERVTAEEKEGASTFSKIWKGSRFVDAFRKKPCDVNSGGTYASFEFFYNSLCQDYIIDAFDPEGGDVAEYLFKEKAGCENVKPSPMSLIDKVNRCLQWVSSGARLAIEQKNVGDEEYYISKVSFGKDAANGFKPQNVGFGISYILPVLVTLLTARSGNIIIIENPEAHLHPHGQAEIGKLIAEVVSRGVQVFVETHSDHVINGIRVAVKKGLVKPDDVNIAFFERKPHVVDEVTWTAKTENGLQKFVAPKGEWNHTEIYTDVHNIKIDENGSLSEYPTDFMDEWNIQQMKLFRRK